MMYHERKGDAYWKSNYTVVRDLDILVQVYKFIDGMFVYHYNIILKYLETSHPAADQDMPYNFKFAQPNGVLHMSLEAPQQEGWTVHPSQDQMEVSLYYYDSVIIIHA